MNKISFLHTHYLPKKLLDEIDVETCVVALEVYPDLLLKYYGEYNIFDSLEECILWHKEQYTRSTVKFTIENIAMLKNLSILKKAKDVGLFSVQLFHSQSNEYYDKKNGLTNRGHMLLEELAENDIVLDLSHLNDYEISQIISQYNGRIMVSHCVCSELIETIHPRTNNISKNTICNLAEKGCLFGIPFVNDLVSKISHDTCENDDGIICDIVSQILFFLRCVGAENVALGPDFMDGDYFSKVFKQDIRIPDMLYKSCGYQKLSIELKDNHVSDREVSLIMNENVTRIFNQ